jgi:hypothetical protein
MKIKFISFLLIMFSIISNLYSQFDKPVLQIGFGISEPFNEMKGSYYNYRTYQNGSTYLNILAIDSSFLLSNYGAKTGINLFGTGKINFDKYSTVRGILTLSYNSFNTFEATKSGNGLINIGGSLYATSLTYNYTFTNFGFGLGLEIAPTSFTNVFSPFFSACFMFNTLGGKLTRTEGGNNDSTTFEMSDFRMGLSFNAGLEYKISEKWGLILGAKYDMANLLLRNTDQSIGGRTEWGRTNASINDEEGQIVSNLYNPILGSQYEFYRSKKKNVNFGTIYLGVNFYFDTKPKKKPEEQKK